MSKTFSGNRGNQIILFIKRKKFFKYIEIDVLKTVLDKYGNAKIRAHVIH